ncbi:hypothetical protein LZ32DRAFT_610518 [Colletotrichum eremochloae]|nr:hypothetical protein LZ32DRAFT_610518 [Colletotrichum eremochloae]
MPPWKQACGMAGQFIAVLLFSPFPPEIWPLNLTLSFLSFPSHQPLCVLVFCVTAWWTCAGQIFCATQ